MGWAKELSVYRLGVFPRCTFHWLTAYPHLWVLQRAGWDDALVICIMSNNNQKERESNGLTGNPHKLATGRIDVHDTAAGRIQVARSYLVAPTTLFRHLWATGHWALGTGHWALGTGPGLLSFSRPWRIG